MIGLNCGTVPLVCRPRADHASFFQKMSTTVFKFNLSIKHSLHHLPFASTSSSEQFRWLVPLLLYFVHTLCDGRNESIGPLSYSISTSNYEKYCDISGCEIPALLKTIDLALTLDFRSTQPIQSLQRRRVWQAVKNGVPSLFAAQVQRHKS